MKIKWTNSNVATSPIFDGLFHVMKSLIILPGIEYFFFFFWSANPDFCIYVYVHGHYPRILFRFDMGLVYHPAHRRNDVEKNPGKYANYFIFLNASIK
jgi:hypothetical protein